jgi:hypothetical protein
MPVRIRQTIQELLLEVRALRRIRSSSLREMKTVGGTSVPLDLQTNFDARPSQLQ